MPTFGFWELTLVMFIALLVVGPARLPRVASYAGHWIGKIKRLATNFKYDLTQEIHAEELQKSIAAPREEMEKLGATLQKTGGEVKQEMRHLDPLVKALDEQIDAGRFEAEHDTSKKDEDT